MPADPARLLALAEAVTDGRRLEWGEEEDRSGSDERALVAQLRLLAGVAEAHTSSRLEGDAPARLPGAAPSRPWGPLEIREQVGSGTFGTVFRAWDPRLDREVALKLLHHAAAGLTSHVIEEGRLLARVRHPHVITVYGADIFDGRIGIWMEFIRGRTLEAVLADQGPLSSREAASIGVDLCAALAAVHAQGLLHRDVKMQNVMREHGGRLVLMDFGAGQDLSLDGRPGMAGTPSYMAPELFEGRAATPQTDLFSLGVLLFRAATGQYPVPGRTTAAVREAHTQRATRRLLDVRPDLPAPFVQVAERALSYDPADRFATAGEMGAALGRLLEPAVPVPTPVPTPAPTPRRIPMIAIAALASALGLAGVFGARPLINLLTTPRVRNVVVLPLTNVGGNADEEYFVDGVTEILSGRLASISGLRVIARSSIAALGPNERDPASLRRRFNAEFAIEGAVQRKGARVLVTARVVQASTGTLLWGDTFDRPLGDLFSLQGEVALAIASALGARIDGNLSRRLQVRQSSSVEAQEAYLQGRYLLYTYNRARLPDARRFFELAVDIDPGYAIAHAGLSRTLAMMVDLDVPAADELEPLARAAATRAFELSSDLPETTIALADVRYRFERNWSAADLLYRRAIELAPHAAIARGSYSRFLCAWGRLDEARRHAEEGALADPLSAEMVSSVGLAHYYARDYDGALRYFNQVAAQSPEFGPVYMGMARALSGKGDYQAAIAHIEKAKALVGSSSTYQAELARTYALGGWRETAEQILGGLILDARTLKAPVAYEGIGYVYAALGDHDRAFEWLNRALDHYFARMLFLNVDPRADPLRADPRFAVLVQRLGLTP